MKKFKELFMEKKKILVPIIACVCVLAFVGAVGGIVSLSAQKIHKHEWVERVETDPTCTKAGKKVFTCSDCGEKTWESIAVDPEAHVYAVANCTKAKTCKDCGTTEGTALGHNYGVATCTKVATCKRCQAVKPGSTKLPHKEKVEEVKATCVEDGNILTSCEVCGTELANEVLTATGHSWYWDEAKQIDCCENENCGLKANEYLRYQLVGNSYYVVIGIGNDRVGDYPYPPVDSEIIPAHVVIPTMHKGKPVTAIATDAFRDSKLVKSLEIIHTKDLVIEEGAFPNCVNLQSVVIKNVGDGKIYIDDRAFENCTALKTVELGNQVVSIDDKAFAGCTALTTVKFGENIERIGEGAFYNCKSLVNSIEEGVLILPAATKTIGSEAFYGCESLEKIVLSEEMTVLNESLFEGCAKLGSGDWSFKIPDMVTIIEKNVFKNCTSMQEIKLGENVTNVGVSALEGCTKLQKVEFTDSVAYVEKDAFKGCINLSEVYVSGLEKWCDISFEEITSNPFAVNSEVSKEGLYLGGQEIVFATEIIIPKTVKEIKPYAFYGYSSMASLTLTENVSNIATLAFGECSKLKTVNYQVEYGFACDGNAFYKAGQDVSELRVDSGIQVVIGKDVRTVPDYLFATSPLNESEALKDVYANVTNVSFEEDSVCTFIGECAFSNCINLRTLIVGENVKTIDVRAFTNGEEVNELDDHYQKLETLYLPVGLENIRHEAFLYCDSIKTVTAPAHALSHITKEKLEVLTITAGYVSSEECKDAPALRAVTLEAAVTNIGTQAFYDCPKLETVTVKTNENEEGLVTIGEEAFAFCQALKSFKIVCSSEDCKNVELNTYCVCPTLRIIDHKAFYGCTALEKLILPETLQFIGEQAFMLCKSLKKVDINNRYQWTISGNGIYNEALHDTDLADEEVAAKFLTEDYVDCSWICR